MFGRLYQLPSAEARRRTDELLVQFALDDAGDRVAKTYSGGMRRRLDLAAALVGRPRLLFLDEPTTGLDPRSRLGLWDVIRSQVREGNTLLLTTQYLEEADELADEIAVVDHGRIIARGTADELKTQVGGERIEVVVHDRDAPRRGGGAASRRTARRRSTSTRSASRSRREGGAQQLVDVVRALGDAGVAIDDVALRRPDPRRRLPHPHRPRRRGAARRGRTDEHAPRPRRRRPRDRLAGAQARPADPGARDLRDPPVDHVRGALRVRLRRRDPAPGRRQLPRVPDAGDLHPDARVRLDHDRDRVRGRHDEGDHRPVPLAADGAVGGAQRADVRGRRLHDGDPRRADALAASSSAGASTRASATSCSPCC